MELVSYTQLSLQHTTVLPNETRLAVTLLTVIWELLGSDLGEDTDYSERLFHGYFSPSRQISGVPQIRPRPLSYKLVSVQHPSIHHPTSRLYKA
jgi:hypothetical protein